MNPRASRLANRAPFLCAVLVLAACAGAPDPVSTDADELRRPVAAPGAVPRVDPKRGRVVAVGDDELSEGNEIDRRVEEFRATVAARFDGLAAELNACYLPELKRDPNLAGYLIVAMTVGPGGKISAGPTVTESTLGNDTVESCVVEFVRAQVYPEPFNGQFTDVSHVFQFGTF